MTLKRIFQRGIERPKGESMWHIPGDWSSYGVEFLELLHQEGNTSLVETYEAVKLTSSKAQTLLFIYLSVFGAVFAFLIDNMGEAGTVEHVPVLLLSLSFTILSLVALIILVQLIFPTYVFTPGRNNIEDMPLLEFGAGETGDQYKWLLLAQIEAINHGIKYNNKLLQLRADKQSAVLILSIFNFAAAFTLSVLFFFG